MLLKYALLLHSDYDSDCKYKNKNPHINYVKTKK